jgi:hypothetical protein
MKVIVRFEVHLSENERSALRAQACRSRTDVKQELERRASALLRSDLEDLARIYGGDRS